jgi:hypothetical protein
MKIYNKKMFRQKKSQGMTTRLKRDASSVNLFEATIVYSI